MSRGPSFDATDIEDAIEAAAGLRDGQISSDPQKSAAGARKVEHARGVLRQFLENVPADISALELLELLGEGA